MQILVTGGMGFIGSHLIRILLESFPQVKVVNLDILAYASNPRNLSYVRSIFSDRYQFVPGDICDAELVRELVAGSQAVFNLAAETHVDRSLQDADNFVRTNVLGANCLLQAARAWEDDPRRRFIQVSTDEVYGALSLEETGLFRETSPLCPSSPYSASKAGADMLALAYHRSFGLPVIITRACNNYGPHQYPEKFIPLMINKAVNGQELPVYGDGLHVREWMFVKDHCRALLAVWQKGEPGQIYNIGSGRRHNNLEMLDIIINIMGKRYSIEVDEFRRLIRHAPDRRGHDRRYALDSGRLEREIGFRPSVSLEDGLNQTVNWHFDHPDWWNIDNNDQQWWLRR
ncbi:MAG: dTDP-glucose 4,6-dehydratase [Desulfarculales bacterium]|nr:dTDP-glucose 4,6-dehydratase [Desulfarculales bacterium]